MRIVYCARSDAFFFFLTDFPLANGIISFHTKFFIPTSYEKGLFHVRPGLSQKENDLQGNVPHRPRIRSLLNYLRLEGRQIV